VPGGSRIERAAAAGAVSALAWCAAEPLLARVLRTGFTDTRLLGTAITRRRLSRPIGVAAHVANGAAFGAAFGAAGGRGWRQGLVAAELEHLATWPAMALVDRWHPEVRSGAWQPLCRSGRAFAQEAAMHALFGVLLGLLCEEP
jgi:hypothetical protein